VFTRTKHGANRLAQQLEGSGIRSAAIHGNKSQGARVRALADFKDNKVTALVATEVAARGLDIKELPHVVNYELPNVPEDYVHRIGRTARAGGTGSAVSLVAPDEASLLRDIERLLRRSLPVAQLPEYPIKASPAGSSDGARDDSRRGDYRGGSRGGGGGRDYRGGNGRGHGGEQRRAHGNGQRQAHDNGQRGTQGGNAQNRAPDSGQHRSPGNEQRRAHGNEQPRSPGNDQRRSHSHSHGHGYGHSRPGGNSGNGNSALSQGGPRGQRRTGSY
jgi:ATP-dependent RNA helicase RhlE